ncbi:hypothetical protein [Azohydromonas australica]|uniref:hypothetical protein n=1 Tax=Azohydromonas australica TaxID=364039 RepID=UPI0012EBFA82
MALILGGTSFIAVVLILVLGLSKRSHASGDCMAQVAPLEQVLPTLTIYSHLPKPIEDNVPHYIRTRARSCFPKLAVQFKEEDIPVSRRNGRLPYLEGDPISVYRSGQLRWLFEVRSREVQGQLLGFVSVGANKGDLQLHGMRSRHRTQAKEVVLSKAEVLAQQRVLDVVPGTKLYVIKGRPSYVVRLANGEGVLVATGILPIEGSSEPSIAQTLSGAIMALENPASIAQVRN